MPYRFPTAALAATLLLGCGGDSSGPTSSIPAELVGNWIAEPACLPICGWTLTSSTDPEVSLNFVDDPLFITVGVGIESDADFELSFSGQSAPERGTLRVQGQMMIITADAGAVDTADYHIQNGYLHMQLRKEYAFSVGGQAHSGRPAGVFERQ